MKEIGTLKEENDWNEMASDQRNWKVQLPILWPKGLTYGLFANIW